MFTPVERMSRRAIYTPVPSLTAAREQALLTLERQPKPVAGPHRLGVSGLDSFAPELVAAAPDPAG